MKSVGAFESTLPVDCVLFAGPYALLVGQYVLDEKKQMRQGRVDVLALERADYALERADYAPESRDPQIVLRAANSYKCAAVLDMQWIAPRERLLIAHDESVSIWHFDVASLQMLQIASAPFEATLALYASVSPEGALLGMSDGTVALLDTTRCETRSQWKAHEHECWTVHKWNHGSATPLEQCAFSGGDDAMLALSDIRCGAVVQRIRGIHSAGITALADAPPAVAGGFGLLTGEFMDRMRLLDVRQPRHVVSSANLGGGVWRICATSNASPLFLVAAMHGGGKIVSVHAREQQHDSSIIRVIDSLDQDMTLCYGADCAERAEHGQLIATCSFYNRAVRLWDMDAVKTE